jgi:hypothetical protein
MYDELHPLHASPNITGTNRTKIMRSTDHAVPSGRVGSTLGF